MEVGVMKLLMKNNLTTYYTFLFPLVAKTRGKLFTVCNGILDMQKAAKNINFTKVL